VHGCAQATSFRELRHADGGLLLLITTILKSTSINSGVVGTFGAVQRFSFRAGVGANIRGASVQREEKGTC
jgi:hypothetical protein